MKKSLVMKNVEIYGIASSILEVFPNDIMLPVKVNFYLQKNIKNIVDMAQELDAEKIKIFDKYGKKDEENGQYVFEPEAIDAANEELRDLFELEQEVIYTELDLDWFDNIELTSQQLSAITYMFNEKE